MNWLNDLNNAMDLIEERLPDEVSLEELARAAGCSAFHLQRMFPYLTGLTLADYLRRRRLSLAAMELADGRRVTDVAFECGMAWQLGKKCFAYMHDATWMRQRIAHYGEDKDNRDIYGNDVENFNYPVNLMFSGSMPVYGGKFEEIIDQVMEELNK